MTTGDNVSTNGAMTATARAASELSSQREQRVEELWRRLDPQGARELDLKGLQKGLRRIDHPMKNADDMLRQIIKMVDSNGDGKIQFEEFRVFVEAAERQLLLLFRSIDRDHDGRLNKDELLAAFRRSGLAVPPRRLHGFFDEIDLNHDGFISFDEWRDFLLFLPTQDDSSPSTLEAAFSYYAAIVNLNAEGDSMVSDETLEGLGTTGSFFQALFGSIMKLARPFPDTPDRSRPIAPSPTPTPTEAEPAEPPPERAQASESLSKPRPPPPPLPPDKAGPIAAATTAAATTPIAAPATPALPIHPDDADTDAQLQASGAETAKKRFALAHYLPHPGYFVAGALAGGISRTATAPFDRLKVYLLVNTKATSTASLEAAKHGHPLTAVRKAGQPIGEAICTLYKAGGLRTFFAGNGLNVVKIMPETAIKFGSYEAAKRTCAALEGHGDPSHINPYSKFVAGGVAGMIAQFCVYPLDTLKFRLQCETVPGGPTGRALVLQTARRMFAASGGGLRVAYRGVTMGLIGMFPYSAIDMGTFELLKGAFVRHKARRYGLHEEDADAAPGNVVTGIIGATSGAFGASVVYPLNVLRTRLQTQGTALHPPTYTGIWDVAQRTLAHEGWRGLYKGLTPNLLKVAPALSITWVVYENSKQGLGLP